LDQKDEADRKFRPNFLNAVAGNFTAVSEVSVSEDGSLNKIVAAAFEDHPPGTPRADDDDRMEHAEDAPIEARKKVDANIAARKDADARGTMKKPSNSNRQPTWFERTFLGKKPTAPPAGQSPRPR
jgi:hypothetical protein